MPIGALIGGAAVIGAGASVYSAVEGTAAQKEAAEAANATAKTQFEQQRADLAPWRKLGEETLPTLRAAYGLGTPEETQGAIDRFKAATPDYGFGFDQGLKATEGAVKASGLGLRGGGALRALTRYGQDYATTRFGNWRDALGVPAGYGRGAVAEGNQASANYANAYGANARAAGDARASGYAGAASGINSGLQNSATIAAYGYGQGWFGPQYTNPDGTPRGYYVRK